MGEHELGCTELEAITALADIDWEPDDPDAVTLRQFAEHIGVSEPAALLRLDKLTAAGKLRMFKVRRVASNGTTRTVRVWKRA